MSNMEEQPAPRVGPADACLIPVAVASTGLTEKAIRRKIEDGVWREGHEYHRGPDGHIYIDMPGYYRWVRRSAAAA